MKPFELLFGFPEVARVRQGVSSAVSQECFQTHIDPYMLATRDVLSPPFRLHGKLTVVAISPLEKANALDLLRGKNGLDGFSRRM